jgi:hypothetical protein
MGLGHLHETFRFILVIDLGQLAELLGWVISLSQGLCVSAPGDCEDGEVVE